MNSEQKKKIKVKYKLLVDTLDFDEIRDYLVSNLNSFGEEDIQIIESEKTRPAKVRMLLKILNKKISPNNIFLVFCDSLRDTDVISYKSLADQIENADISLLLSNDANGDDHTDDANNDASVDTKIAQLQRHIMEQTNILLQVLKMPNADHVQTVQKLIKEELDKIPQFQQFNKKGQFVVNENIEQFSNFRLEQPHIPSADNSEPVLRPKKNNKPKNDSFTEIASKMGEHAFTACTDSCSSDYNNYSAALQRLLEKQPPKFKEDIKETVKGLHILEMVGYQTVDSIADGLFYVCNWGRIITWFAFWKQVAQDMESSPEEEKLFGSYVGFHIAKNPVCRDWIEKNGGWEWILNAGDLKWYEKFLGYLSSLFQGITSG